MIIVDNDFATLEDKNIVYDYFLGAQSKFQWSFNFATNYKTNDPGIIKDNNVVEQFQMSNHVNANSEIYPYIMNIMKSFLDKHSIPITTILRVKANLLTRGKSEGYHLPHVDTNIKHKVFLYYVNDCDGDTIMFDKKYDGNNDLGQQLSIVDRISPAMGKAIVFDGDQYHSSSSPIESDFRCVINIDFIDYPYSEIGQH